MRLTPSIAERIAGRMRHDGFTGATAHDVMCVYDTGTLPSGHEWGESLASRILNEFEEYGIRVPA